MGKAWKMCVQQWEKWHLCQLIGMGLKILIRLHRYYVVARIFETHQMEDVYVKEMAVRS